MSEMPERDISGKCDDCEDLVKKGEKERQKRVEESGVKSPKEYPDAPGAKSRNASPGSMGGKV
jgi:hypothetical protein